MASNRLPVQGRAQPVERSLARAVTMADVAAIANVSVATVSRALGGRSSVAPDIRARVAAAAQELEYRPNRLARNLRRQKTDMIGVVVSDIENPHFAEMVHVTESDMYRQGYRVLLCNTDESDEKQRVYLEMLASERPLGVIIAPCDPAGEEITHLLDLGIPVVAFDRPLRDERADAVLANNAEAARLAVEHLLMRGYERIGFVGISPRVETGAARLAGYKAAMAAHGLEPICEAGGFRTEAGIQTSLRLLARDTGIDAIITANNMMAISVLRVLRDRELSVPEDIALVTFDDPYWAEFLRPSLTTLAQPVRAMVAAAVRLLIDRIEGRESPPQRVVFNLDLRVRESSTRRREDPITVACRSTGRG